MRNCVCLDMCMHKPLKCAQWMLVMSVIIIYHLLYSQLRTEGGRGGELPRAALPKGRHFREKLENLRKNRKIYVKKG